MKGPRPRRGPFTANVQVRANGLVAPGALTEQTLAVVAATPALPAAVRGTMATGRFFDDGDIARRDRVAVLGDQAARLLGIDDVRDAPAVFFKGQSFTVIGVLGGFRREQRLSASVILPPTTAADRIGMADVTRVLVNTSLGAAHQVARQAPIALSPGHEDALTVTAPPDLTKAGNGVEGDVNGLFLVLGLSLIVGAIGVANVTLVTVMERVGKIGLCRAPGWRSCRSTSTCLRGCRCSPSPAPKGSGNPGGSARIHRQLRRQPLLRRRPCLAHHV